jgi:hypothetical protein
MIDSPNAETIGTCETKFDMDRDARLGSIILRGAIRDLLSRMPERKVREVLGAPSHPPIPGTERVYRGQAAERLAA